MDKGERMRAPVIVVAVAAVVLTACGTGEAPPEAGPDLLFLRTNRGVAVIDAATADARFHSRSAVPAADWSTAVSANVANGTTSLTTIDTDSGAPVWSGEAPGRFSVKTVSGDGDMVALSPLRQPHHSLGRTSSRLLIVRKGSAEPQSVELSGNYEPEAFSTDGTSLFVLKYTPARRPAQYQVRRLDLGTETVHGVFSVDDELQESMRGTARVQTMSPDGRFLYTLYSAGLGPDRHAFIHVLNLEEKWAHCIDLPHGFADVPQRETTVSVAPNGDYLYVANSEAALLAEVDTRELSVTRTAPVAFDPVGAGKSYSGVANDAVFLARGSRVLAVDRRGLGELAAWSVAGKITGLQAGENGRRLYIASERSVTTFDARSGEEIESFDPQGLGAITQLGPVTRPQFYAPKNFTCAC